jgi:phosphoribosylformylglycinamidine cyclo-ligase
MKKSSTESTAYASLGASSAKTGILDAVGEEFNTRYFAQPSGDILGDPHYSSFLHADGAGTKSIVAYLLYRETGNVSYFRTLATDSLVMNLDDLACVGALDCLLLSNTIGRNRSLIPDLAIREIIEGYRDNVNLLQQHGLNITLSGGETADVGDLVRTLLVDSTLAARVPRSNLVDTYRTVPGDLIIGFSSTGRSKLEQWDNSGIGSNGLTLARNLLLSRYHVDRYPEVSDPAIDQTLAYQGNYKVTDTYTELPCTIGEALLSPTKTYAPLVKSLLETHFDSIHSLIHCTGGGQTKIKRFGRGVSYEKEDLFPVPPLFSLIQRSANLDWGQMYAVFNMGHRLEACVEPTTADEIIERSRSFGIEAKIIGSVRASENENTVRISSPFGTFSY